MLSISSMPWNAPAMLKVPFFDLCTAIGGLPPHMPTEFWPLMSPTLATFFAIASTSSGLKVMSRPIGMPS